MDATADRTRIAARLITVLVVGALAAAPHSFEAAAGPVTGSAGPAKPLPDGLTAGAETTVHPSGGLATLLESGGALAAGIVILAAAAFAVLLVRRFAGRVG